IMETIAGPDPVETNVATVRRFDALFEKGLNHLEEIFAADYIHHDDALPAPVSYNLATYQKMLGTFTTAFPDLKMKTVDSFGEGNTVVTRWTAEGTHKGLLFGTIAATGKPVKVAGLMAMRLHKGKIIEGWSNWDAASLLAQLGVQPAKR